MGILPFSPFTVHLTKTLRQTVKALHIPHAKSAVGPWVTISLGVATCLPSATLNPINLIRAADGLLYQAKQQGRDRLIATPKHRTQRQADYIL